MTPRIKHRDRRVEAILVERALNDRVNALGEKYLSSKRITQCAVNELQEELSALWGRWLSNHPWLECVYGLPAVLVAEDGQVFIHVPPLQPPDARPHINSIVPYKP